MPKQLIKLISSSIIIFSFFVSCNNFKYVYDNFTSVYKVNCWLTNDVELQASFNDNEKSEIIILYASFWIYNSSRIWSPEKYDEEYRERDLLMLDGSKIISYQVFYTNIDKTNWWNEEYWFKINTEFLNKLLKLEEDDKVITVKIGNNLVELPGKRLQEFVWKYENLKGKDGFKF